MHPLQNLLSGELARAMLIQVFFFSFFFLVLLKFNHLLPLVIIVKSEYAFG